MSSEQLFVFGPFRLDLNDECVRKGTTGIALRPKTFAVLRYLLAHAGQVVSKAELIGAVWPNTRIVESALKVSIWEIRQALKENPKAPTYIEAVGRRGYRFMARVSIQSAPDETVDDATLPAKYVVGRSAELKQLGSLLEKAQRGKRQIVFVTGEPGIGKTTLVETFVGTHVSNDVLVARGQCVEPYGAGEPFLPILDVIERLANLPCRKEVLVLLRKFAPSWLATLPALVGPEEREDLARQTLGTAPERRLREIAGFLEELSTTYTIILVLEDLHWIDPSTLMLISYLAHRPEFARLMIIGTYRDNGIACMNHPLNTVRAELVLHHNCTPLPLGFLTKKSVQDYLALRFDSEIDRPLLSTIYNRSHGNPLFMINITDDLLKRGFVAQENGVIRQLGAAEDRSVPETVRDLIDRRLSALAKADRELLEAAAIAGMTFSAAAVSSVLGQERQHVESRLRDMAKAGDLLLRVGYRQKSEDRGTARYTFVHVLYQNVLYDQIDEAERRRLHLKIALETENTYRGQTPLIAAELAQHFELASRYDRAISYFSAAAQSALRQGGFQEALSHTNRGLALFASVQKNLHRDAEVELLLLRGSASSALNGFTAEEARQAYENAQRLCAKVAKTPSLFRSLTGLWSFRVVRGEYATALQLARRMLTVSTNLRNADLRMRSHVAAGMAHMHIGNFARAGDHFRQSDRLFPRVNEGLSSAFGWDSGVVTSAYYAQALWFLGYPDRSLRQTEKSLALAQQHGNPFNLAVAFGHGATAQAYRNHPQSALLLAEQAIKISEEERFHHWLALATIIRGWALTKLGHHPANDGISLLIEGQRMWYSAGARLALPFYQALLAECYLLTDELDKADRAISEGFRLSALTKERYYEAQLHLLRGELILKRARPNRSRYRAATESLQSSLKTARQQRSPSLQLRAAASLCHLSRLTGQSREPNGLLKKRYSWFKEGFDSPDLQRAKALLDGIA